MAQGYTASQQIWNDSFIYEGITVDGKVDGNRALGRPYTCRYCLTQLYEIISAHV